jgi:hypothetical protein
MRLLYDTVESHWLTHGYVNFRDQSVNGELVKEASRFKHLSTLDLKDASDRVRWDLVRYLFPGNWVEAFEACRTTHVELPDGIPDEVKALCPNNIYELVGKFAPMGSAVCFPVEALVFWSLLKAALGVDVYVYGDDIIVPAHCFEEAVRVLEEYDLLVNVEKSCHETPFRESCGVDYFDGVDVGYAKLRKPIQTPPPPRPRSRSSRLEGKKRSGVSLTSEVSLVQFVNQLIDIWGVETIRKSGIMRTVDGLYGPHPTELVPGPLSYKGNPERDSGLGLLFADFKCRWNTSLQCLEWLLPDVAVQVDACRTGPSHGWGELFRFWCQSTSRSGDPLFEQLLPDSEERPIVSTSNIWKQEEARAACGHYAAPGCTKKHRWRELRATVTLNGISKNQWSKIQKFTPRENSPS